MEVKDSSVICGGLKDSSVICGGIRTRVYYMEAKASSVMYGG